MHEGGAAAHITEAGLQAISALRAAGVASEALAELVPPKRRFLRTTAPTMRPLGLVWRLGVLLLTDTQDPAAAPSPASGRGRRRSRQPEPVPLPLWLIAGPSTRSAERGRPNFQSESREERREIAAAALRGGYPVGTVVHFDAVPLPELDADLGELGPDSPVGVLEGVPRVRWRAGASLTGAQEFDRYVAERVDLLTQPPLGAS